MDRPPEDGYTGFPGQQGGQEEFRPRRRLSLREGYEQLPADESEVAPVRTLRSRAPQPAPSGRLGLRDNGIMGSGEAEANPLLYGEAHTEESNFSDLPQQTAPRRTLGYASGPRPASSPVEKLELELPAEPAHLAQPVQPKNANPWEAFSAKPRRAPSSIGDVKSLGSLSFNLPQSAPPRIAQPRPAVPQAPLPQPKAPQPQPRLQPPSALPIPEPHQPLAGAPLEPQVETPAPRAFTNAVIPTPLAPEPSLAPKPVPPSVTFTPVGIPAQSQPQEKKESPLRAASHPPVPSNNPAGIFGTGSNITGKPRAGNFVNKNEEGPESFPAKSNKFRNVQAPVLNTTKRDTKFPDSPREVRRKEQTLARLREEQAALEAAKAEKLAQEQARWKSWFDSIFEIERTLKITIGIILGIGLLLLVNIGTIIDFCNKLYQPPFYVAATGVARQQNEYKAYEQLILDEQPKLNYPIHSKDSIRTVFRARNGGSIRMDKKSVLSVVKIEPDLEGVTSVGVNIMVGRLFIFSMPTSQILVGSELASFKPSPTLDTVYEVAFAPERPNLVELKVFKGQVDVLLYQGRNVSGSVKAGKRARITKQKIETPVPLGESDAWERWNQDWQLVDDMPAIENYLQKPKAKAPSQGSQNKKKKQAKSKKK